MILRDARAEALSWVRQALLEELHAEPAGRAEALVAIAIDYEVTIEELVQWIHFRAPGKLWSTREFIRWANGVRTLRQDLERLREQEAAEQWKICPHCWAHIAQRVKTHWLCAGCGEVE
jgi:hypothetical protein